MYNQSNKPAQANQKPQGEQGKKDSVIHVPATNVEADKSLKAPIEAPAEVAKEGAAKLTPVATGEKPVEAAADVRKN